MFGKAGKCEHSPALIYLMLAADGKEDVDRDKLPIFRVFGDLRLT